MSKYRDGILLTGWIARDSDRELCLHEHKPTFHGDSWYCDDESWVIILSESPCEDCFKDVTPETEPIKVAMSLVPYPITPQYKGCC